MAIQMNQNKAADSYFTYMFNDNPAETTKLYEIHSYKKL